MKFRFRFVFLIALAAFCNFGPTETIAQTGGGGGSTSMTIMPMGDSNTRGYHGDETNRGAYRQTFVELMSQTDIDFDMVGQLSFGRDGLVDIEHQGVGGHRVEQMTLDYAQAVFQYKPDYVFLMAGTNNHNDVLDYDVFFQRYDGLLSMIKNESPATKVIMSTVPKFGCCRSDLGHWSENFVDQRNTEVFPFINGVVKDVALEHDNVQLIDFFSKMDPHTDLTDDQIHLNNVGHAKLGRLFYNELMAIPEPGSAVVLGFLGLLGLKRRRA